MKAGKFSEIVVTAASIFYLFSGFASGQDEQGTSAQLFGADLDIYFNSVISQNNFISLGACLIKDNKIIQNGAYGYADRELRKELKVTDIFHLASLSKTITATALMQLYEKGLCNLDEDINEYISPVKVRNPYFPDKPITVRMLLTHTAGFEDVFATGNKLSLGVPGDCETPLSEFIRELFTPGGKYYSTDFFSKNEPGTKYGYSNIAFSLVGYIAERVSGMDFSEFCKKNIFIPMDMKDTGWFLRDIDTSRLIWGYGYQGNYDSTTEYSKGGRFGLPGYPEGMLRSTMEDLSHFLSAYMNKGNYNGYQMLRPETVELMLTPQGIKNIPGRSFPIIDIGLTWLLLDIDGEQYYSMNGFSGKIFASAFFSPKKKTAFLFFYTGVTMKNMASSIDITKKLRNCFKEI